MKIIRTLDVSINEFYDYLEHKLLADIASATGQHLTREEIKKGLHYAKRPTKGKSEMHLNVDDYQRGRKYQVTSKTPFDTVTVTYLTEGQGEKTEVTLLEDVASYDPNKTNRFIRLFSQTMILGRMADTLMSIEDEIRKEATQQA